jgi:hypothetical protein
LPPRLHKLPLELLALGYLVLQSLLPDESILPAVLQHPAGFFQPLRLSHQVVKPKLSPSFLQCELTIFIELVVFSIDALAGEMWFDCGFEKVVNCLEFFILALDKPLRGVFGMVVVGSSCSLLNHSKKLMRAHFADVSDLALLYQKMRVLYV